MDKYCEMKDLIIREEKATDFEPISNLHIESFNHDLEAKLIMSLRKEIGYKPIYSQVVELCGQVVGHAMLTPVEIVNETKTTKALVLGPVSITQAQRGKSLGTILVQQCIEVAKKEGYPFVLVYGGDYYKRFGFKKAKYVFRPNPVFGHGMKIVRTSYKVCPVVRGVIHYPESFRPLTSEWGK